MKLLRSLSAAMAILTSSCSTAQQPAKPPPPTPPPAAANPLESPWERGDRITGMLIKENFGPLHINQPEKEILATLGEPRKRGAIRYIEATGVNIQEWAYPKSGLSLRMASSSGKAGPKFLNAIYATAKCPYTTRRGIQVGSTQADAQKAYADSIDLQKYDLPALVRPHLIVGSIFAGIVFEFTGGKVSGIFYGPYAECHTSPAMTGNR